MNELLPHKKAEGSKPVKQEKEKILPTNLQDEILIKVTRTEPVEERNVVKEDSQLIKTWMSTGTTEDTWNSQPPEVFSQFEEEIQIKETLEDTNDILENKKSPVQDEKENEVCKDNRNLVRICNNLKFELKQKQHEINSLEDKFSENQELKNKLRKEIYKSHCLEHENKRLSNLLKDHDCKTPLENREEKKDKQKDKRKLKVSPSLFTPRKKRKVSSPPASPPGVSQVGRDDGGETGPASIVEAERRVLAEYSEALEDTSLPPITPELLKSRRTHSLQLALGEILNNGASMLSAARKYQIPTQTLRRHYHNYLGQQSSAASSLLKKPSANNLRNSAAALVGKKKEEKSGKNSNNLAILNILEDYKERMRM